MYSLVDKPRLLWICRSALFIALLVVVQFVTGAIAMPAGQFVTGSLVNLILILAVLTGGLSTGIVVAILSPFFAKLIGIGPLWEVIPFIMLGNFELIVLWHLLTSLQRFQKLTRRIVAAIVAAVGKFAVLFLGIVLLAVPIILQLPEPQATIISAMFTWPQLITALIGGVLAIALMPAIEKGVTSLVTKVIDDEQKPVNVQKLQRQIAKQQRKKQVEPRFKANKATQPATGNTMLSSSDESYVGKHS